MKVKDYAVLFFLGLLVAVAASLWVKTPGYMDAEYYYTGGIRLAEGQGFTEMVLWNYLDNPTGLPHPSHLYWMPLASLVSAAGLLLLNSSSFTAARFPFLLLAALVAPFTAGLAYRLRQNRAGAWLAGALSALPGFYAPYLVSTDTFALVMLLGAAMFLLWLDMQQRGVHLGGVALLGIIAGLMHLARTDGIVWLWAGMAVLLPLLKSKQSNWIPTGFGGHPWVGTLKTIAIFLAGYMVVMAGWFLRNFLETGSILNPGGWRMLFLSDYNQTFSFPPDLINLSTWLAAGFQSILAVRWSALLQNLSTWVGVQNQVVLLPLTLTGLWILRRHQVVCLGAAIWVVTLFIMSVIFPFAGTRGGFFHSGAALQPLIYALVPIGLEQFINLGVRFRGWRQSRAWWMFSVLLIAVSAVLTAVLFANRVVGTDPKQTIWDQSARSQTAAARWLFETRGEPPGLVMVNNPPGYFAVTSRPAIVIPDGDERTLLAAAGKFGARYLILDKNLVPGLANLYHTPGNRPGLQYLGISQSICFYRITGVAQ